MSDSIEFPFPQDITRAERLAFEKHAQVTFAQFGSIIEDPSRHDEITVRMEAALIFIAARRKRPTITFDEVVANDGWTLAPAPEVTPDPLPAPDVAS